MNYWVRLEDLPVTLPEGPTSADGAFAHPEPLLGNVSEALSRSRTSELFF